MSVANSVRDELKTIVEAVGIGISPNPPAVIAVPVKVRKRPQFRKEDGPAVIVVTLRTIKREYYTAEDDMAYQCEYELGVTPIVPNDSVVIATGVMANWREQIELAVLQPNAFANVPEVSHVTTMERPLFSIGPLDKNYDYTPIGFKVVTIEALS